MGLLTENSINTEVALELYDKATGLAERNAKKQGKKSYAAIEIETELTQLIRPILLENKLLDPEIYSRIEKLINNWYSEKEICKCAAVQHSLINLLPDIKEALEAEIKTAISELRQHLESKIRDEGIPISGDEPLANNENLTVKQQKLITRYVAIRDLDEAIKGKSSLDASDIETAKTALSTCLKNRPDWSE